MSTQTDDFRRRAQESFAPVYSNKGLVLERGEGSRVWDVEGREFVDLSAGIAVCPLGHNHPDLAEALRVEGAKLWCMSNIFLNRNAVLLAEELVAATFADRAFFCNSGAEANEAAFKLARKYGSKHLPAAKRNIVLFHESFHGRTLATTAATGQPKYQQGYDPLPAGFTHIPFNDPAAADKAIGDDTLAVMLEPIQGEGGVVPAADGFLTRLRRLCDERGALLIYDEIQSGMGRTGKFMAWEWEPEARPDIATLAKGLAGGVPIGAMLATERVASAFGFGDHGSTFGGNSLATGVARAVVRRLTSPEALAHAAEMGAALRAGLEAVGRDLGAYSEVRGRGLMLGAVLSGRWAGKARELLYKGWDEGLLMLNCGGDVLRFLPPLVITRSDLDEGLTRLRATLKNFEG